MQTLSDFMFIRKVNNETQQAFGFFLNYNISRTHSYHEHLQKDTPDAN